MQPKIKSRGGTRKNAGAKPKYPEKTKMTSFRVPISKITEFRAEAQKILNQWKL